MWSVWNESKSLENLTLSEALERLAKVAARALDGVDERDLVAKINLFTRLIYVNTYKNKHYGDAWKDESLGYRINIAFLVSKYRRLINLAWRSNVDLGDVGNKGVKSKIIETIHDLINYAIFAVRMIEIEYGVSYGDVRGECIEKDYEDLDLEGVLQERRQQAAESASNQKKY